MVSKFLSRNNEIKEIRKDIPLWIVAERLEIHENTLRNWLRQELPQSRKDKIIKAILEIRAEINEKLSENG